MEPVINLLPSADTNALVSAIGQASQQHRTLVLQPGIHLTRPGYNQQVPVGAGGLHIKGTGVLNSGEYGSSADQIIASIRRIRMIITVYSWCRLRLPRRSGRLSANGRQVTALTIVS